MSHHAKTGHNLKTRAHENHILYNRLIDYADGTASYALDLPNGGLSFIIGNEIQQGPSTGNSTIVSYGAEGLSNPSSNVYVVNNTIVNDRSAGNFLRIQSGAKAEVINNLFIGPGTPVNGDANETTNLVANGDAVVDRDGFNFLLSVGSPAINAGTDPGSAEGVDLTPVNEYVQPTNTKNRSISGVIDIGAHEL